ncbi:hypothetical protein L484_009588 [Morus notabilis]|uniref:Uncharacterized protein n=1 Tax=Morus notabilis TaxID=981085 RepID=W9QBX4_9ROSA|nr:hypothetical protein L484_009588 [Morus notabilis]
MFASQLHEPQTHQLQEAQNPQDPFFPNLSPNSHQQQHALLSEQGFGHTPLSQTSDMSSDENNVYSEFHRISELFRTAFSK